MIATQAITIIAYPFQISITSLSNLNRVVLIVCTFICKQQVLSVKQRLILLPKFGIIKGIEVPILYSFRQHVGVNFEEILAQYRFLPQQTLTTTDLGIKEDLKYKSPLSLNITFLPQEPF